MFDMVAGRNAAAGGWFCYRLWQQSCDGVLRSDASDELKAAAQARDE